MCVMRCCDCAVQRPIECVTPGSKLSVEDPTGGVMYFQSLDDAAFTVTLAYDADSTLATLEAAVEAVGLGDDTAAQAACAGGTVSGSGVIALAYTQVPAPAAGAVPIHMELLLPLTTVHNTFYRVLLRATDGAGNVVVNRTNCVLVDKTPPTVRAGLWDSHTDVYAPQALWCFPERLLAPFVEARTHSCTHSPFSKHPTHTRNRTPAPNTVRFVRHLWAGRSPLAPWIPPKSSASTKTCSCVTTAPRTDR